jgi:hypothetical protein
LGTSHPWAKAKTLAVHGQIGLHQAWAKNPVRVRRIMGEAWKDIFPDGTGPEGLLDFDNCFPDDKFMRTAPNGSHFSVATPFMISVLGTLAMPEEENLIYENNLHTDTTYNLCSTMYTTTSCMFDKRVGVSKTVFVSYSR